MGHIFVSLVQYLQNTCNFYFVDNRNILWNFDSFLHPQFTPGLPWTRSGKIMRRILRKIAANKEKELGDVSTLADPSIVDTIVGKFKKGDSIQKST